MYKTKNSVYDLQYHLVLVTKYRHSVLSDDIAYCLTDIIYEILENKCGANIIELNIQPDHVHIMFEAKPSLSLTQMIGLLKSASTKILFKKFKKTLSKKYWKPHLWNPSYCICTVSERSSAIVKEYVASQ